MIRIPWPFHTDFATINEVHCCEHPRMKLVQNAKIWFNKHNCKTEMIGIDMKIAHKIKTLRRNGDTCNGLRKLPECFFLSSDDNLWWSTCSTCGRACLMQLESSSNSDIYWLFISFSISFPFHFLNSKCKLKRFL